MATGGIGNLTVFLGLDAGEFANGLNKAQAQSAAALDRIKGQVEGVSSSLKSLAAFSVAGIGVAYFKGIIDDSIEARANLLRLSTTTGETVENLSALSKIGKFTGTGIDEISRATVLLNKNLASGEEGSKNAQKALQALGISYESLKSASPAAQLQIIAQALAGFEDGAGKATAATFLLGKAGADLLPFLKDLGEQQTLVGKVTAESARQAEEYRRNLITLQNAGEEWKKSLANSVIPTLAEFTSQLVDGRKAFGGYISALVGITTGSNPLNTAGENLASVRKEIDEVSASLDKAKSGSKGLFDAGAGFDKIFGGNADAKQLQGRLDQLNKLKAYFTAQQTREALGGTQGQVLDRFDKKPRLDVPGSVGDTTAKATKELSDFDKLFKQVNGTLGEAIIQFDALDQGLGKVDAAHLAGAKIAAQLAAGELKLTDAQIAQIDATLKQQAAVEKDTEALRRNIEWMKEATEANAARVESLIKSRDALQAEALNAEDAVRTYGLTREALDALAVARDQDAAAALRQKAAIAEGGSFGNDALAETAKLYRDQADAIDQTAAARQRLSDLVKQTQDAVQLNDSIKGSFESAFTDFATGAKSASDAFKSFTDGVIAGLIRIAAQRTAEQLFGGSGGIFGGAGGGAGLLGNLFGGGSADLSAPGAASDAGNGLGSAAAGAGLLARLFSGTFATGGYIPPGQFGLVGEKGPELAFGGQTGRTITPLAAGGGGRTNNIVVNVPSGAKPEYGMQVGAAVARQIAIADRRNN